MNLRKGSIYTVRDGSEVIIIMKVIDNTVVIQDGQYHVTLADLCLPIFREPLAQKNTSCCFSGLGRDCKLATLEERRLFFEAFNSKYSLRVSDFIF